MKIRSTLSLLCATLAIGLVPVLKAQPAEGQRGPGGPGGRGPNIEMLAQQLNLTADQKTKLEPVLKSQQEKMQALRKDESLSREDRQAKNKAIREEANAAIKAVLTPEQATKFADLQAKGPRGGPQGKKGDKPQN